MIEDFSLLLYIDQFYHFTQSRRGQMPPHVKKEFIILIVLNIILFNHFHHDIEPLRSQLDFSHHPY